jgi:NTE family protein
LAPPSQRLERLREFWRRVQQPWPAVAALGGLGWARLVPNAATVVGGIPGFFGPSVTAWRGVNAAVGVDQAAYCDTAPLRETLRAPADFARLGRGGMRLTVGAVHALSSAMRYFDSRHEPLGLDHVMALGALPPAFPAVRIRELAAWGCSNADTKSRIECAPSREPADALEGVVEPH